MSFANSLFVRNCSVGRRPHKITPPVIRGKESPRTLQRGAGARMRSDLFQKGRKYAEERHATQVNLEPSVVITKNNRARRLTAR